MKTGLFLLLLLVAAGLFAQTKSNIAVAQNHKILFDSNWRFMRDSIAGAEQPGYNDAQWRKVDLPHDWSIEDLPHSTPDSIIGPFSKGSIGKIATGFAVGGTGWYRKQFTTPGTGSNGQVLICFDGVYMFSDVWLNGHYLGNHAYGYSPFCYNLTPYLKAAGSENLLAVRVRNEGKNSRWYSGSGIYRHVWLTVTGPVHVAPWGVAITTPDVTAGKAMLHINTTVNNGALSEHRINIVTTIFSPRGKAVGRVQHAFTINANATAGQAQSIVIARPLLWSLETPQLYKAVTEIKEGDILSDRVETSFGIRSIRVDAVNGLLLNGKKTLLKGGCIHHDNGPLGAAAIDRAEERKIEILKKNGFNAIRLSHNPPSTPLLEACDRLGMLVVDEAFDMWERPKNPEDYHLYFKDRWQQDIDAMVLRDRNHPAVIMWSIGNEINERADSSGLRIAAMLRNEVHRLDAARPVTEAICSFWDHAGYKWDTTAASFALLDVGGYNYMFQAYEADHKKFPQRIMMGTESFPGKALENWNMVEKHPYVIGDFVWTAFDYLGEASIGHAMVDTAKKFRMALGWPWFNAYCGDIDITGNKKSPSYYRDVVWRNSPIAMAVHAPLPEGMVENVSLWGWPDERQSWTWPGAEGKLMQVRVFSRAPMVRLLLNGKVIGEEKIKEGSITAVFNVPYQPGILKAVNIENGKETGAAAFKTAGTAKRLRLTADRTTIRHSRNDLSYITVEVIDDKGQLVPDAAIPVRFSLSGNGEIAGVGSGNPTDMASFQQPQRTTWRGKCLVILRPLGKSGAMTLAAAAPGLAPGQAVITTK